MPPLERTDLLQRAVLWSASGRDRYGQVTVGDPVEITVRWLDQQSQMLDPQGNTVTVDVTVVVQQDIKIGSQMWLGELADLIGTGSEPETGRMEVKAFNSTLDIKARNNRRTIGLMRMNLPATDE